MKKTVIFLISVLFIFLPTQVLAQKRVPILVYHSIDEFTGSGSQELYVTPESFEEQIKYLRDHGFTLLTFENWEDINHVDKPIFLTFDDGYKNNEQAFKTFKNYKMNHLNQKGRFLLFQILSVELIDLQKMT